MTADDDDVPTAREIVAEFFDRHFADDLHREKWLLSRLQDWSNQVHADGYIVGWTEAKAMAADLAHEFDQEMALEIERLAP